MIITYDKYNGIITQDGKVNELALSIIEKNEDVTIGSELLIDAIRLAMLQKNVDHKNIKFLFENNEITINNHYQPNKYPTGFCDTNHKILLQLIGFKPK